MYLKNRTIQDKSTKYREIQDNFLIFPKYRKCRKYRTCGSLAIISEMSWCNVLQRAGLDYRVNSNFPGTFTIFRLKIFTQEKVTSYGDPYP